ncbi:unnamed protein product [Arctogadus glacialis]
MCARARSSTHVLITWLPSQCRLPWWVETSFPPALLYWDLRTLNTCGLIAAVRSSLLLTFPLSSPLLCRARAGFSFFKSWGDVMVEVSVGIGRGPLQPTEHRSEGNEESWRQGQDRSGHGRMRCSLKGRTVSQRPSWEWEHRRLTCPHGSALPAQQLINSGWEKVGSELQRCRQHRCT